MKTIAVHNSGSRMFPKLMSKDKRNTKQNKNTKKSLPGCDPDAGGSKYREGQK